MDIGQPGHKTTETHLKATASTKNTTKTLKPAYDLYSERRPNDVFLEILTETWAHAAHCPSLHTS